jgi:RNA polymerase sigma-70 factor (ECF subfamily)
MSQRNLEEQNLDERLDEVPAPASDLDDAVRVFLAERTRLVRVAYRVVGDFAAAEDVVQEAWLRWQRVDRREIKNPAAFLTTATTHLAINLIQSASYRHELPAELPRGPSGTADDPAVHVERARSTEQTLGFLMAKLSGSELAALLLRKSFELSYQEVADLLGTTAPNARQLVRRAHLATASGRVRRVPADLHRQLVAAFLLASETGDLAVLVALLVKACGRSGHLRATHERGNGLCRQSRPTCVPDLQAVTPRPGSRSSSVTGQTDGRD